MISLIIPIYNAQSYIESIVRSILNQLYKDFELILVDDGSADNSGAICDELSRVDGRIKTIHQNNKGASAARNAGIVNSTGELLTFIDVDDDISSDYLERLYNDYKAYQEVDLVIQGMVLNKDEAETKYVLTDKYYCISGKDSNLFFENIFLNDFSGPCCKLFSAEIIHRNSIYFNSNIIYAEDFDFLLRYLRFCNYVVTSSATNYHYLMRKGSVSTRFYAFCKEYGGFNQLVLSFEALLAKYPSNSLYNMMKESVNSYAWRIINSNYKNNYTRSQRIDNYKLLENTAISYFVKFFDGRTIFAKFIKFMLVHKYFVLLDVFLSIRIGDRH